MNTERFLSNFRGSFQKLPLFSFAREGIDKANTLYLLGKFSEFGR